MSPKTSLTPQQRANETLSKIQAKGSESRSAEVVGIDEAARTVELAFSSEAEVKRWFGIEVLSHDAESVDLARLNDGGAVLHGHNTDAHRGVVERAWIDADRKGRALVRFSRSAAAEDLFQDVIDKIVRHVSVGYRITAIKLTEEREDVDVYTVTRWEPYEISFVPIPADTSVGVGRSAEGAEGAPPDISAMERARLAAETSTVPSSADSNFEQENNNTMKEKILRDAAGNLVRAKVNDEGAIVEVIEMLEKAGEGVTAARTAGTAVERDRVRSITDMANQYGKSVPEVDALARDALANGNSPEHFQRSLLEAMDRRASQPLNDQLAGADVGLTEKQIRNYSIMRVVRALTDPTDARAQKEAAFEFEVSGAARAKQSNTSDRFVIPTDVLRHAVHGDHLVRAPMSAGKTTLADTGGNLIATELQPGSFIDLLRNSTSIMRRGRVLGGLVGNIDIPKKLAGTQGFWLGGEDAEAAETGTELGQIGMTPKTVAAFTEFTRKMMQQSSINVEQLLRADLAESMGLTIDRAGYYGSGTLGEPLGIANMTGINAVAFAAVQPTFVELVAMETAIAADNAVVDGMSYAANTGFRGHAKTTLKFAGVAGTLWEQGGTVNGYSTEVTNQIDTGDVFLNNYNDFLVGLWGGLELHVDPFTHSRRGRIRITTFQDVDFAARRLESFCLGRKPAI